MSAVESQILWDRMSRDSTSACQIVGVIQNRNFYLMTKLILILMLALTTLTALNLTLNDPQDT